MNPLVSIVITNYNYAQFLPESIESALSQRYHPLEVLVIDDGSTDHSRQILEQYAATGKVRVIYQENQGQALAFQRGVAEANGEYLVFLDADDILLADAVAECMAVADPQVSRIQFFLRCVDSDRRPLGWSVPEQMPKQRNVRPLLLQRGGYPAPPTSGNVWSRRFLEQVFPLRHSFGKLCADAYLAWLAPFFGDVVSVPRVLGEYRIHLANKFAQADSLTNPAKLKSTVMDDFQRTEAIEKVLHDHGIAFDGEAVLRRNAEHMRRRFLLAQLAPEEYRSIAPDRPMPRVWNYVATVLRSPELSPSSRLLWAFAGLATALAPPGALKQTVANRIWNPQYRFRWAQALLQLVRNRQIA